MQRLVLRQYLNNQICSAEKENRASFVFLSHIKHSSFLLKTAHVALQVVVAICRKKNPQLSNAIMCETILMKMSYGETFGTTEYVSEMRFCT